MLAVICAINKINVFMIKKLLKIRLVFLLFLSLLGLSAYSQTTYDFSTAAALSFGTGGSNIWNTQADITIGGVAYRLTSGGNGSFTNATTGGVSNGKCLQKDGSGGDQFTLQRTDGKPFQFYGMWVKHQSMNSYTQFYTLPPWYTLTASTFSYSDNTPMVGGTTYSDFTTSTQTISAGTNGITTSLVQISFPAIIYFCIDDIVVGPTPLTASTSQTDLSCNGDNNGTAKVTVSGGSEPYTYSWSPSGGTGAAASGLVAGTYTCTITDAANNKLSKNFTITEPSPLVATKSQTNVSCNGDNNGSAIVSVSGGTSPYTYSWLPSGGTSATANGLSAGNYTCIITDAHNCNKSVEVKITQPDVLTVAVSSITNVTENGGNNGSATVVVYGGTPPYTYSWSPSGGKSATATGLTAGSYICLVKDANECTTSQTVNILSPSFSFTSSAASVNFKIKSAGTSCLIDWGDGNSLTQTITDEQTVSSTNAYSAGKTVKVYGEGISQLNISAQSLKALDVWSMPALTSLRCSDNNLNIATLPQPSSAWTEYIYAPQKNLDFFPVNSVVDLSAMSTAKDASGAVQTTAYAWFKEDGTPLVAGTDYTTTGNGIFDFITRLTYNAYCVMTNVAFPGFTGTNAFRTVSNVPTGVSLLQVANMTIYPNPTQGMIYITTLDGKIPEVKIFNLQGLLLLQTKDNKVNLSSFDKGVYVIEVNGEKTKVIKK